MNFLNNIQISKKLPVIIVLCALITSGFVGALSYMSARDSVTESQQLKLVALREVKKTQLSSYLDSIQEDIVAVASNPYTLEALRAFDAGWMVLGENSNPQEVLQELYIHKNPNRQGEKDKLVDAKDGSFYSDAHADYHPWFRSFLQSRGYYDIFLFNTRGDLVYSVFKEMDYATNLNTGEWKDSDLGHAFRTAQKSNMAGEMFFFDFKSYAPSAGVAASFISTPIIDNLGKTAGVLVFQMPIGRINHIMQAADGMGESGESYIVGEDYLMRSDSRFSKESTILKTRIDGETARAALKGESGIRIVPDYRGISVLSAYSPFEFMGTQWAVLTDIDESEVMQPVVELRNRALQVVLFFAVIIVVVGTVFARSITRPISAVTSAMEVLAKGDTSIIVPESNRKDEVGDMAQALEVFKQNRIEADRLAAEQKREQERQIQRGKELEKLTENFSKSVGDLINSLSSASTELNSTAQSMSSIAEEATAQSSAMSVASDSTAQNIQTVASAAEELSTSIRELSQQVSNTSKAANTATKDVDAASRQIGELLQAAEKIGDVVKLIQDIAEQTNLLALNATIESARAGEAGKGFAVVANEVKTLANETAKATEQIGEEVRLVQSQIRNAVEAVRNIEEKITDVNTSASAIAAAIEEQNAATEEISRNTQISTTNMRELTVNISGVNEAASTAGTAANDVLSAATEVSQQTEYLKGQVSDFIKKVNAI